MKKYLNLNSKKNIIITFLMIIFFWIFLSFIFSFFIPNKIYTNYIVIFSTIFFVLELYLIYKINGILFSPTLFFLLAFYVFQNGQLLLKALNIEFYSYYIDTLPYLLGDVSKFSSYSLLIAGFSAMLLSKDKNKQYTHDYKMDKYKSDYVSDAALFGVIITGFVALCLVSLKFSFAIQGGYYFVRSLEDHIPKVLTFFEYMFIPFSFLYLIYSKNNLLKKILRYILVAFFTLTALCGDRTTGIAGLLSTYLIGFLLESNNNKKRKKIIVLFLLGIFLMLFIKIAFSFRLHEPFNFSLNFLDIFVEFLEELGIGVFPLFAMMNIVPKFEHFQYGSQYILSMISGFCPSTLDFTGVISSITKNRYIYDDWLTKYYSQYNFGLGFSLNAEAYINFGWFGLFAIFFLCCVIFSYLSYDQKNIIKGKKYTLYRSVILLFIWFTLPRRNSYYIWNALFWCVIIINIYIKLYIKLMPKFLKYLEHFIKRKVIIDE